MAPRRSSTSTRIAFCVMQLGATLLATGCGGEDQDTAPEPERRASARREQNVTGQRVEQLVSTGGSSVEIRNVAGGVRRQEAIAREESEQIRLDFEADPAAAMARYAGEMRAELEAVDPRLGSLVEPSEGDLRDRCVDALGEDSASVCDSITEESMDCLERGETAWTDEDCREALAPIASVRNRVLRHQRNQRNGASTPPPPEEEPEPLAPTSLQPATLGTR